MGESRKEERRKGEKTKEKVEEGKDNRSKESSRRVGNLEQRRRGSKVGGRG